MSGFLLAEFVTAAEASEALRRAHEAGRPAQDLLSPIPLEDGARHLAPHHPKKPIGWIMVIAGTLAAGGGYFLQWYSAVVDYPIHSGGRPLNSWPAFLLMPYEAAILAMGIVGILGWLWMCGLPKLYHPLFDAHAVERASQDSYLLVFAGNEATADWIETELKPLALHEVSE